MSNNNKDRFATISLILGIVAIVFCCVRLIPLAFVNYCTTCLTYLMSIAGIVLGIMGIKSSKKMLAIVGIVLCVLALLIPIVTILISFIFNLGVGGLDVLNNIAKPVCVLGDCRHVK